MVEAQHVARLRTLRAELRSQIIFEHIATPSLQVELINREEYQRINSKPSDAEKMDVLLDILSSKDIDSFERFKTLLQTDYPWIVQKLQEEEAAHDEVDGHYHAPDIRICRLNQVITRQMIKVVRQNHRVVRGWTGLAHTLEMDKSVYKIRNRVLVYGEDVDLCVVYLLQEWVGCCSKQATLDNLLKALREEGYNDVADELEAKFG